MSYLYKGCYEDEGVTYIKRQGLGTSVSFNYMSDLLNLLVTEDNGKRVFDTAINAQTIYDKTNQGSHAFTITLIISESGVGFNY